ncbi:uncharacterized protein LOC128953350 [Oppia nitens]|uniref:uncharacterized protein LOC128953350 n=1 Tax=Oppia nitens TaxID=1686743 RepID=UPI0023DA0802|nr:uncharacterized protein LOC128953350 [Oppia nitens]
MVGQACIVCTLYYMSFAVILLLLLNFWQIFGQNSGTAGNPRGQHCRGFNAEEIPYPTPYISALDRADRCQQLFPKYNSTGTANPVFIGQNTYHNPCKIECGLCDSEQPDSKDSTQRSYPAHISQKDDIVKCPETSGVEIYEQFMEDGLKCGPYHVCDNLCCVAHPDLYPKAAKRRSTTTPTPQDIPQEWTQQLDCPEEGYFRNPNDCHKFYRCHTGAKGKLQRTLYNCNPTDAIFDEQLRVCVTPEETDSCEDIYGGVN